MMPRDYECMIIFNPEITLEEKEKTFSKIKSTLAQHDGAVEKVEEWGKRALSYPIKKKIDGDYSLVIMKGSPLVVKEINEFLRLDEKILRFLILSRIMPKPVKIKKQPVKQAVNEQN